jgi:hypothetical protein
MMFKTVSEPDVSERGDSEKYAVDREIPVKLAKHQPFLAYSAVVHAGLLVRSTWSILVVVSLHNYGYE